MACGKAVADGLRKQVVPARRGSSTATSFATRFAAVRVGCPARL